MFIFNSRYNIGSDDDWSKIYIQEVTSMTTSIIIKLTVGYAIVTIGTAVAYHIAHKAKSVEFNFFGISVKSSN